MVAVIKMTWEHKIDGKCCKFAHDSNKTQSGRDVHCLILCSFEITFSYNVQVYLMHIKMKSNALYVYTGSKRCYKLADDIANQNIELSVEIKCQLDATEVFIADIIACSCFGHHCAHHQELKSVIQWLLPVVFHAVVFRLFVWCGAEGYVSGFAGCSILQNRTHNPQLHTRPTT